MRVVEGRSCDRGDSSRDDHGRWAQMPVTRTGRMGQDKDGKEARIVSNMVSSWGSEVQSRGTPGGN